MKHLKEKHNKTEKIKQIKCSICGEMYEIENGECPRCFSGCCDPAYHNGEPCDGSC